MAKKTDAKVTQKTSKKSATADKPVVLVAWSKVKKTVELRVSKEVKFALTEHLTKLMKNAEELALSDNMKTIKGTHIDQAVANLKGTTPAT